MKSHFLLYQCCHWALLWNAARWCYSASSTCPSCWTSFFCWPFHQDGSTLNIAQLSRGLFIQVCTQVCTCSPCSMLAIAALLTKILCATRGERCPQADQQRCSCCLCPYESTQRCSNQNTYPRSHSRTWAFSVLPADTQWFRYETAYWSSSYACPSSSRSLKYVLCNALSNPFSSFV